MTRRVMKGALLAGVAALGLAGVAAAREGRPEPFGAREGGRWSAFSKEDRAAFADARIAALHAGLRLTPDQEKLWPPVETAMRDFARLKQGQREARAERGRIIDDAPGALRAMADAASARADALRKLADASAPLYATLDPDQKRRALVLARPMRPHHGHGPHRERGPRGERD